MSETKIDKIPTVNLDGIPESIVQEINTAFGELHAKAKSWEIEAKSIVVANGDDLATMKRARELRLKLRELRVDANNRRKALKEDVLLRGRAIDGFYNVIAYLITPLEKHLQEQEDFVKLAQEKMLNERFERRLAEISQYTDNPLAFSLRELSNDAYAAILQSTKDGYEARIAREAQERAEREEQERITNRFNKRREKLSTVYEMIQSLSITLEFPEKFKDAPSIRTMSDEQFDKEYQDFLDIVETKIAKAKEAKRKADLAKREAEEKARKAQAEADELRKKLDAEEAEKQRLADVEAEKIKQQELAPDREKIKNIADIISNIQLPIATTKEGQAAVLRVNDEMNKLVQLIYSVAERL